MLPRSLITTTSNIKISLAPSSRAIGRIVRKQCRLSSRPQRHQSLTCSNCGDFGRISRTCPSKPGIQHEREEGGAESKPQRGRDSRRWGGRGIGSTKAKSDWLRLVERQRSIGMYHVLCYFTRDWHIWIWSIRECEIIPKWLLLEITCRFEWRTSMFYIYFKLLSIHQLAVKYDGEICLNEKHAIFRKARGDSFLQRREKQEVPLKNQL